MSNQDTIEITINGESHSITPGISLADLLENLELPQQRVAIELNRSIASRHSWKNTFLKSGDALEIVHFVGGG